MTSFVDDKLVAAADKAIDRFTDQRGAATSKKSSSKGGENNGGTAVQSTTAKSSPAPWWSAEKRKPHLAGLGRPEQPTDLDERTKELLTMLTFARPGGSTTEQEFVARFITPLGVEVDKYGNLWKQVGDPDCPILWSCHTDTVHKHGGKQRITLGDWFAMTEGRNCLGADCTTGVWLMRNMIKAGIPGRYVFHQEEETGGCGSSHVKLREPERLKGIKFAIAFDRKGYNDVITHQGTSRTCSDRFAESLAELLGHHYKPSSNGIFTDTANYAYLVPECTNISVGYHGAHTGDESQDVFFAGTLLDTLLKADFTKLVCARDLDAAIKERQSLWSSRAANRSSGYGWGSLDDYYSDWGVTAHRKTGSGSSNRGGERSTVVGYPRTDERAGSKDLDLGLMTLEKRAVLAFILDNPLTVTDYLVEAGVERYDLDTYAQEVDRDNYQDDLEKLFSDRLDDLEKLFSDRLDDDKS